MSNKNGASHSSVPPHNNSLHQEATEFLARLQRRLERINSLEERLKRSRENLGELQEYLEVAEQEEREAKRWKKDLELSQRQQHAQLCQNPLLFQWMHDAITTTNDALYASIVEGEEAERRHLSVKEWLERDRCETTLGPHLRGRLQYVAIPGHLMVVEGAATNSYPPYPLLQFHKVYLTQVPVEHQSLPVITWMAAELVGADEVPYVLPTQDPPASYVIWYLSLGDCRKAIQFWGAQTIIWDRCGMWVARSQEERNHLLEFLEKRHQLPEEVNVSHIWSCEGSEEVERAEEVAREAQLVKEFDRAYTALKTRERIDIRYTTTIGDLTRPLGLTYMMIPAQAEAKRTTVETKFKVIVKGIPLSVTRDEVLWAMRSILIKYQPQCTETVVCDAMQYSPPSTGKPWRSTKEDPPLQGFVVFMIDEPSQDLMFKVLSDHERVTFRWDIHGVWIAEGKQQVHALFGIKKMTLRAEKFS